MNLAYKVFHLPGLGESAEDRARLSSNINQYLSQTFSELNTPTIKISNQEEYERFNKEHGLLNPTWTFKYGELGVWASNLLAMKNFLDSEYDYLMLMEDDIAYNEFFTPLLNVCMQELPADWDIFSYFCHPNQFVRFENNYSGERIVPAYQDWSMLCYILNRRGAQKMLDSVKETGINQPIDWYIFRQPDRFKTYTLAPYSQRPVELYETSSTFQQLDDRVIIN
jgi:GR25 family glycosyltransferase involved in LPS biosynthesis